MDGAQQEAVGTDSTRLTSWKGGLSSLAGVTAQQIISAFTVKYIQLRDRFERRSVSSSAAFPSRQGLDLGAGLRLAVVVMLGMAVLSYIPFRSEAEMQAQPAHLAARPTAARIAAHDLTPAAAMPSISTTRSVASAASSGSDRRAARPDPQSLCDLMAGDAGRMSWAESPLFPGEWECISPLSDGPETSDRAADRPLFAMARGRDAAKVDVIRLKLSLDETDPAAGARKRLLRIATAVLQAAGRSLPGNIEGSLETLTPARSAEDGVDIAFIPERISPGRYNLVIKFD